MLNEEKTQFQLEQDQLLKTVLNTRFFDPWANKGTLWDTSLWHDSNLEIYVTNVCNQNCEYCYLKAYPDLYPKENLDEQLILHNLKLLYDYIIKHEYHIPKIEFFSGEIWHTSFGLQVLTITLDYLKNKNLQVDWFLIASNCTFVFNDKTLQPIQNLIEQFQEIGRPLVFSISVDGDPIEAQERPLVNGTIRDTNYWDRLFSFAKFNHFCFHPMVASNSTKQWIENYKWWIQKFQEYEMDITNLMMLEVRNNDWTDENIDAFCDYLKFEIEYLLHNFCHDDIQLFANRLFGVRDTHGWQFGGYLNFGFPRADTFMGCTIATDLTVRLGDLAICPCHRTAYNKLLYGHFVVQNNEIIDITANNPQMAIVTLMQNQLGGVLGCDSCLWQSICLKGCFGSQYETMNDPLIPIPSVCHFFDRKYSFLIDLYEKMGVIDYLRTFTHKELNYLDIRDFLTLVDRYHEKQQMTDLERQKQKEENNNGMGNFCANVPGWTNCN